MMRVFVVIMDDNFGMTSLNSAWSTLQAAEDQVRRLTHMKSRTGEPQDDRGRFIEIVELIMDKEEKTDG